MDIKKNVLFLIVSAALSHAVILSAATFTDFVRNYNLPVLHKEADFPIYQIRSEMDLGGWTCGFFTLKNAKDLEHYLGLNNKCDIKSECQNYLNAYAINPLDALNNKQLTNLADHVVKLKNFNALHITKDGKVALMPEEITWNATKATNIHSISTATAADKHRVDITIEAPFETTNDQIDAIAHDAASKELNQRLVNLSTDLQQSENGILNFGCILEDETHVFLVSVVQLGWNERALLVYDNLNHSYTDTPARRNFVETIYKTFCV